MATKEPVTRLEAQFSSPGATPTAWAEAQAQLEKAEIFWLSTVRPDGRPHVTPLIVVWLDGALYFSTGVDERKAKNLAHNTHCVLTTGCNALHMGLDVVVEGDAQHVEDEDQLQRVADLYASKYGWQFEVRDHALYTVVDQNSGETGKAVAYKVTPTTVFGFGRGEHYSQTRWRF